MSMFRISPRRVWIVALFAAATLGGGCQTQSEYRVLSQRPDRVIAQLDNGLVVMAQKVDAAPVASVQCWIKTGSVYEGQYNGMGLSHFLEHLLAGGSTTTRTEAESNKILGQIGARTNASTSLDQVRYYIDTSAEHAAAAVDLLSDWMLNSTITQEEYAREQQVILREFQMGRGEPGRIFWKLTQQARYRTHPARHPVIGYEDEFKQVTRDQIYDFYKRMYVPNNMVFVVSGDIDPRKILNQVNRLWKLHPAAGMPGVVLPIEKPIDSPRTVSGEADIDRPRLRLAWPGVRLASKHDYPLDILGQVLGQGELSRLVQTVRDQQRLVTSIDAYNYSMAWGEGFFGIDAVVEPDKMDAARDAILEQVKKIKTIGVTPDELARAKRKTIASVMYAAQTAHAVGERLADDFINTGDPDYLAHYAQAIEHVTITDVQMAANAFLDPDKLITVKLTPQKGQASPPMTRPADSPALGATDYGNQQIELVDLDNERLVNRMMRVDKAQAAARPTKMSEPKMVTLDNGLRVIVQTNTRLPIVAMQWYQLGGLLADRAGHEGAANAMMEMMMRGAAGRSADDIARRLEELGAQVSTNCGNSTFYVAGQCLTEDWAQVLGLMADVINKPDFPADEWGKMKPRLLAAIDSMDDTWYMQLRNALRREYFGEQDPWSQPTAGRHEVVDALTADQLKQFHADHLSAQDGVLAIVGDIDEQKVIQAAKDLFGAMPASAKIPFQPVEHAPVNSRIAQVVSSKPLVAMQIAYGPGMKRANPDYAPMLVMNEVLDTFPVGWFSQALRGEGPGLVYAVGSGMFSGVSPGYWAVLFNTQPDTASMAMQRALKVVDRIRTETVDADTLNRAREAVLVSEATSHQTNAQLATEAALAELYGLGFKAGDQLIQQIHGTTAADVQRVAQKYLQNPLAVILTPKPIDESTLPALK